MILAALLALQAASAPAADLDPLFNAARVTKRAEVRCAEGAGEEIVVCGRRVDPERYRVPPQLRDRGFDPKGSTQSVSRERNALMDGTDSSSLGSCSTVGPGGMTGCLNKAVKRKCEQETCRFLF